MLRRTSPRFLVLVFLLSLVGIIGMSTALTLAQAQPADDTGNEQAAHAQQQDNGEQDEQTQEPALDADAAIAAAQAQAEEETQDADSQSGGRFIPTEQISQDLGVSFPVDI